VTRRIREVATPPEATNPANAITAASRRQDGARDQQGPELHRPGQVQHEAARRHEPGGRQPPVHGLGIGRGTALALPRGEQQPGGADREQPVQPRRVRERGVHSQRGAGHRAERPPRHEEDEITAHERAAAMAATIKGRIGGRPRRSHQGTASRKHRPASTHAQIHASEGKGLASHAGLSARPNAVE
jgi:hypothetical protein